MISTEDKRAPGRPKKCSLESIQELIGVVISSIAALSVEVKSIGATCNKIDKRLSLLENRVEMIEENVLETRKKSNNLEKRIQLLEDSSKEVSPDSSKCVPTSESSNNHLAIEDLQNEIEKMKQSHLNNSIFLCGDTVSNRLQHEDVNNTCVSLLAEIPNLNIQRLNIINCKKITQEGKPDKIKVQFGNSSFRKELFSKFFKMKKKHFFINEVLIPRKAKLFFELRMLQKELRKKKKNIIKSAFTRNGDIYYILLNADKPRKLCNSSDMDQLIFACQPILNNIQEEDPLTIQNE